VVAVVSGSGLGLFGSTGNLGNALTGRGGERVYVNTATGNLVIQSVDETLSARGLDLALVRTYNSQGLMDDDNGDNWRLGVYQRVYGLTGTLNTAGSTITKLFGDGRTVVFTYDSDSSVYVGTDGEGAHDTLTNSGGAWTWRNGSGRNTESYDNDGRMVISTDAVGNARTYSYDGENLTLIVDASGQQTHLDYDGDLLTQVRVVSEGHTQTLTRYGYDSAGRLNSVTVDLSPEDNDITDENVYVTSYTYENTSRRVASITQTDGSALTFTYELIDTTYRVRTFTDAENAMTAIDYSATGAPSITVHADPAVLLDTESSTEPADFDLVTGALVTGQTQQVTNNYNLNTGALTTPSSWGAPSPFNPAYAGTAEDLKVVFNQDGNGWAIWREASHMFVNRYRADTGSWDGPTVLENQPGDIASASISVGSDGNTVLAYLQYDSGMSRYAVRARTYLRDPYWGTDPGYWGSEITVGYMSSAAVPASGTLSVDILNTRAGIAWVDSGNNNLYYTEITGGYWSYSVVSMEPSAAAAGKPAVAVQWDGVTVAWRQSDGTAQSIYVNQFSDSTYSWSGATLLESSATAADDPVAESDYDGNTYVAWRAGSDLLMRVHNNGTWANQTVIDTGSSTVESFSIGFSRYTGSAIAAWVQSDGTASSVYASRSSWGGSSWTAPQLLETSTTPAVAGQYNISAGLGMNGEAVVAWLQSSGTANDLVAASFNGTNWSPAGVVDTRTAAASRPAVGIAYANGNPRAMALWHQDYNGAQDTFYSTVTPGAGGAPYYTIPSGATWQSLANSLYGVNSAVAGAALQTAMGSPTLSAGAQITGWPAILAVATNVPVPPYYLVPNQPDPPTWSSIAEALYLEGSEEASDALEAVLGGTYPTLTVGMHITGLPAVLHVDFPIEVQVDPYWVVTSTQWEDAVLAIYGTDDPAAIAELQLRTGVTTLSVGDHLTAPLTLEYSEEDPGQGPSDRYTDVIDPLGFHTTLERDAAGRLVTLLSPTVNGARLETRFAYDAEGNVIGITQGPPGLGRSTTMEYDGRGNALLSRDADGVTVTRTWSETNQLLTETHYRLADPDGAQAQQATQPLTTHFVYDAQDRLRFTISPEGRVIERRYVATGELESTRIYAGGYYTNADFDLQDLVDWAGSQDADRVQLVENEYDDRGNLERSTAWGRGVNGSLAPSISQFAYDQRGRLLQSIDPRGAGETLDPTIENTPYATTNHYDGLGRLVRTAQWISEDPDVGVVSTDTNYDDLMGEDTTIRPDGVEEISVFGYKNELLVHIVQDGEHLTNFYYDANGHLRMTRDENGALNFFFYDAAGRKIAEVDGDGTLTEFVYNGASDLIKTIQYSGALDPHSMWDNDLGSPIDRDIEQLRADAGGDPALRRVTRNIYDAAGRLAYAIDQQGSVTQMIYDGTGRVVEQLRFADRVAIDAAVGEISLEQMEGGGDYAPTPSAEHDRRTRNFYDDDGHMRGTLDGEGYLVEYEYDAAGHNVQKIEYATAVPETNRTLTTLDEVRPPLEEDPETWIEDVHSYFYYDGQGRQVGVLNAEGFLTETRYDVAGNISAVIRYGYEVDYDPDFQAVLDSTGDWEFGYGYSPRETWEWGYGDPIFLPGPSQEHVYSYDGAGRLVYEKDHEDIITQYGRDQMGRVVRTTRGLDDAEDERATEVRYNALGLVEQEISAEGLYRIEHWDGTMPAYMVDETWEEYGTRYEYDGKGRRISATTRPSDDQVNKTWFYYDDDNHLRFEINSLGERKEYRYNVFGQLEQELSYYDRLLDYPDVVLQDLEDLEGGFLNEDRITLFTRGESAGRVSRTIYAYAPSGLLESKVTQEGSSTTYSYNAFGEVSGTEQALDATRSLEHTYDFDRRGLLTTTHWDPEGLNTSEHREYDAFGRLTGVTDARNHSSHLEYDALGRQTAAVDAEGGRMVTDYDPFDRVIGVTPLPYTNAEDGIGFLEFTHDIRADASITPEGEYASYVERNAHGQVSAELAGPHFNLQVHQYDHDGNLLATSDDLGTVVANSYDRANRRTLTTDARGVSTRFRYDAANRVVRQIADSASGGLQLETVYEYDALGRLAKVTEPNGRVTTTEYDGDGRVTAIVVNPSDDEPIRTEYHYDLAGNIVLKIEDALGAPRRTRFEYDVLGRKTLMIVDPEDSATPGAELNLTTQYYYDQNGNLTREIDPEQNSTWYVYDANNRVLQTVDALGGVTENTYAAHGYVTARRRYATHVETAGFGNQIALQQPGVSPLDRVTHSFYDSQGREQYTIDTLGGVIERRYDITGNVIFERVYANRIDPDAIPPSGTDMSAVLEEYSGNPPIPYGTAGEWSAGDHVRWMEYDARGRLRYVAELGGAMTQLTYDGNGNVVETRTFATPVFMPEGGTLQDLENLADDLADLAQDHVTRSWYDSLGRLRFTLDAEGYLRETQYDTVNRSETSYVYAQNARAALPAFDFEEATIQDVAGIVDDLDNAALDQTTETVYDLAGRVARVNFADGTYEAFTYDGNGNRLTYRNQAGSVWSYLYDANGRLLEEHSPIVSTTVVSIEGDGLTSDVDDAVIITRMTYDDLGNVETRTEGIRVINGVENPGGSRTTTYRYDALGRQTRIEYPTVKLYNGSPTDYQNLDPQLMAREYDATPTSTVIYNTLGDAVVNVDVNGAVSRKAYDKLGRLVFDVDALGHVTQYGYDVFGNQTSITRIAAALPDASASDDEWSGAFIDTVARGATDRTIEIEYDRLGRQTKVKQPAAFAYMTAVGGASQSQPGAVGETRFEYDAFGNVTLKRTLLNPVTQEFAETHYFYDHNGRKRYEVDPLHYMTQTNYDASGNVLRQIEFSHALDAGPPWDFGNPPTTTHGTDPGDPAGYDRDTEFVYDNMGRLTEQRVHNVEYMDYSISMAAAQFGTQTTTYGYDAVGNRTRVTAQGGATTYTYFDELGRMVAMVEPTRLADQDRDFDGDSVTPYVEMRRDVYGNLAQEIRYRQSAVLVGDRYEAAGAFDPDADHSSLMLLDVYGRAKRTQDGAGAVRYASYNARGDMVKEWQFVTNADGVQETLVTIHKYDLLGREIETIQPMQRSDSGTGTVGAEVSESMRFYQVAAQAPEEWVGTNTLRVYWPELAPGTRVHVKVEYTRRTQGGGQGEAYIYNETIDEARGGAILSWQDGAGLTDAGVYAIQRVQVYTVAVNNSETLTYDSTLPAPGPSLFYRQTVFTQLDYNAFGEVVRKGVNASHQDANGEYQEEFEYDNAGRVRRSNSGDGVDKMYFYDVAGRTTLELRSQVNGLIDSFGPGSEATALAQAKEAVMRTETVYNAIDQVVEQRLPEFTQGGVITPVGDTLTALRVDHERLEQQINSGSFFDTYYRWQGQNVVVFDWADVGAVPVRIIYNYLTIPGSDYGYNAPQSEYRTREVNVANGGDGYRDEFETVPSIRDWTIEQGIATSPAGVRTINWVQVFGQDGNGEYTVLLRSLNIEVEVPDLASPKVEQQLDRWGNVISYSDTADNTTRYRYNVFGALVEKTLPQSSVLDTRSTPGNNRFEASPEAPTQENHFDIQGRAIGTRDANGNLNRRVLDNAGLLTQEIHADTGVRSFVYDTFGNQVQITDETSQGWRTRNTYDGANRVASTQTEVSRTQQGAGIFITRAFGYDGAGRRISETSGELMADNVTPETTKYSYDLMGNMSVRRTPMGRESRFEYDIHGRKAFESNGNGDTMTWTYDAFGRVLSHRDLAQQVTNYSYDNGAGLLTSQTSSRGQDITYEYDEAGNLLTIDDDGVNRTTEYEYDQFGRRVHEKTVLEGLTYQDLQITFDSQNRINTLADLRYSLTYSYDAQGNRTRINATYKDGSNTVPQDVWYVYDGMNRVLLSQGTRTGDLLDIGQNYGIRMTYNLDGTRASAEQNGYGKLILKLEQNPESPNYGEQEGTEYGRYTETYGYDGGKRLTAITRTGEQVETFGGIPSEGTRTAINPVAVSVRSYDNASRQIKENWQWGDVQTTYNTYDDDGRLDVQTTYGFDSPIALKETQTNFIYDNTNVLISYRVAGYEADGTTTRYMTFYYVGHHAADSYMAGSETVNTQSEGDPTTSGSLTRTYNANNELVSIVDDKNHTKNRYFANNADGQAMVVVQGDLPTSADVQVAFNAVLNGFPLTNKHPQQFFFANGQNVGTVGQLHQGQGGFVTRANFDVNYTPLEQLAPTTPPQVVAQQGDTLRKIAARVYGDESLWYLIADENGELSPDAEIAPGRMLTIPSRVVSMANNAESFNPFNVGDVIGDLTPTQMAPPPAMKNGCGVLGMIIVFVVMIVVTYYTAGAAAGPMAEASAAVGTSTVAGVGALTTGEAFAAAAIGAAAGSIASQGVAMALGMQDKFSWKSVLGSALTAGIIAGSGINTMFGANPSFGQMMVQGAAASMVNQGVNLALGLQDSFSWREVAISSVSSAVSGELTEGIESKIGQGFIGSISSTVVRVAMGGRVEADAVLADVFANVIGNSITAGIDSSRAEKKQRELEQVDSFIAGFNARNPDFIDTVIPPLEMDNLESDLGGINTAGLLAANGNVTGLGDGPASEENLQLKVAAQAALSAPGGLAASGKYARPVDPAAILNVLIAGVERQGYSTGGLPTRTDIEVSRLLGAVGYAGHPMPGGGVTYPSSLGFYYTESEIKSASEQIRGALGQGAGWDETYLPSLLIADPDATPSQLYDATVNAVGGYSDAALYGDFKKQIAGINTSQRLINVSLAAAQGDARASAHRAELVEIQDSAAFVSAMWEGSDPENIHDVRSLVEWRGATRALPIAIDVDQALNERAFADDPLAPAALRDDARHSLYLRGVSVALDLATVLPVTRPFSLGAKAVSVAGRRLADLAMGRLAKMAELVGQPSTQLMLAEIRTTGRALIESATARNLVNGKLPFGFSSQEKFAQFGAKLNSGLRAAGYGDVQAIMQGSSVTGRSYKTGRAFDVGRRSDFDIALSSESVFSRAQAGGVELRSAGTRTAPLTSYDLKLLGLRDLALELSQMAGRPVKFMVFESTEGALVKAPSILIPR
jgi:YD repeat-containing protein